MPDWLATLLPYLAQALGVGVAVWIAYEVHRRKFERRIATRYLYGGKRDQMMVKFAAGSFVICIAGVLDLLIQKGGSPYGVAALLIGLISTALSDYRELRTRVGLQRYSLDEMEAKLAKAGFAAAPALRNIGHNPWRMTFIARRPMTTA